MTMKRILVGTDFSPTATRAVGRAAVLAAAHGAELVVCHVAAARVGRVPAKLRELAATAAESAHEQLERAVTAARERGAKATGELASGATVAALVAHSKRVRADLVVVGVRGERTIKDAVIGTTAERLVERGVRSVLLVRREGRRPYRAPLVCLAIGSQSEAVLQTAAAVTGDATLQVLHAYEPPFEPKLRGFGVDPAVVAEHRRAAGREAAVALAAVLEHSAVAAGRLVPVVRRGTPARVILQVAEHAGSDLVVIGRARAAVADLFLGSVSKHVIRSASVDVLVVVP